LVTDKKSYTASSSDRLWTTCTQQ